MFHALDSRVRWKFKRREQQPKKEKKIQIGGVAVRFVRFGAVRPISRQECGASSRGIRWMTRGSCMCGIVVSMESLPTRKIPPRPQNNSEEAKVLFSPQRGGIAYS